MPGCLMPWCHSAMIMGMSQRHNVTMPMIMIMGNNTRWWQWLPNNTRWRRTPLLMKYSNTNLKCHKWASQDPVKLVCAPPKSSGQALVHYFCQNSTLSNLKKFNKTPVSILSRYCIQTLKRFASNPIAISSPAVILCPLITLSYRSR